jgi:hypothetical protein
MKQALKFAKRCCRKQAIIFLVTAALIAAVVGCTDPTPLQYGLTITESNGGSVTAPGQGAFAYDRGARVVLLATPEDGYRFASWSGDVATVADIHAASTLITMNGNYLVSAGFEALYSLTISSTAGGSVTAPGEGAFSYEHGTVVDLVALADECCTFLSWTGDAVADPGSPTTTITTARDAAKKVTANFAPLRYELTTGSTGGGSVTLPGEGTFTYDCGTVVNLAASPQAGYRFLAWTGGAGSIADAYSAITTITMSADYVISASFVAEVTPMVSAGAAHTVGLKADSRVVAAGRNSYGQGNVGGWRDIVQIAAGGDHTVGLKSNGTVVAVGRNDYGQCDVGGWTDIVQIAAGSLYTVGVKSNGTVVAAGRNAEGQCNVGSWTNIIQVAAGSSHTLGLKSGGTVVATGANVYGECEVKGWTDIIRVAAGAYHTLGLKSNGTVVAVGWDVSSQLSVGTWQDIAQIDGGYEHSVGLRSDGNLVGCVGWRPPGQCDVGGWNSIVHIAAGGMHTVGLKTDGTVLAAGQNDEGQCEVGDWNLN